MGYYTTTKVSRELNVIRKISENEIVYVLYRTEVNKDGVSKTNIINCYKDEDKVINKIENYPTHYQNEFNYKSIIIEPDDPYGVIYTFYIVNFEDINSSQPTNIKVISYLCTPPYDKEPKGTTKFTESIGVYKEDNTIIVRMQDVGNIRMNRNEIIAEAKELRKQYLMKQFDI